VVSHAADVESCPKNKVAEEGKLPTRCRVEAILRVCRVMVQFQWVTLRSEV